MAIIPKKTGFQVSVCFTHQETRLKTQFKKTVPTMSEAEVLEATIKHLLQNSESIDHYRTGKTQTSQRTLSQAYVKTCECRWSEGSKQRNTAALVVKHLGEDTPLSSITTITIAKMKKHFEGMGNSTSTVNTKMIALNVMLTIAVEHRWIKEVPHVKTTKVKESNPSFLSKEEVETAISTVTEAGHHLIADIFEVSYLTGCRIGELLALKGEDVSNGFLTIKTKNTTGTKADKRLLPITTRVEEIITYNLYLQEGMRVFPVSYSWCRKVWDTIVRPGITRIDKKDCTIHILRHSFASRLLQQGVAVEKIREWMDHSDIRTTYKYAKSAGSLLNDMAKDIEELL